MILLLAGVLELLFDRETRVIFRKIQMHFVQLGHRCVSSVRASRAKLVTALLHQMTAVLSIG